MKPVVDKRIELAQILLYLADMQEKTRQLLSNKRYSQAIEAYFTPFREHPAVALTRRKIQDEAFFHIRPLQAVLALDEAAMNIHNPQHEWALHVEQFIKDTDFDTFFEGQSSYYNWILQTISSCDFDRWIAYIENYFRQKPRCFHLFICPIAGNYGFTLNASRRIESYVVRCMPYYHEDGQPDWDFDSFARGIAHEYGHCFVNPVVESHRDVLLRHKHFFEQHTNISDAYNVDYAVINEYWVRAFAIRFMEQNRQLFPAFDIEAEYCRQRESFIFIDTFVKLLKEYETSGLPFPEYYAALTADTDAI